MTQELHVPISESVAEAALEDLIPEQGAEKTPADVAQMAGSIAAQLDELPESMPMDRKRRVLLNTVDRVNSGADDMLDARAIKGDVLRAISRERFYRGQRSGDRRIL